MAALKILLKCVVCYSEPEVLFYINNRNILLIYFENKYNKFVLPILPVFLLKFQQKKFLCKYGCVHLYTFKMSSSENTIV